MNLKILFTILFLFYFIAATPLASLCHNHEIDGDYHDDCPACRWEVQSLGDDPQTNTEFIALARPYQKPGHHCVTQRFLAIDQPILAADHSRAPPSIP